MAEFEDLIAQGLAHQRLGRFAEAKILYDRVLAVRPDNADAYHLLGLIALDEARLDQALELIDRAIALDPNPGLYHSHRGAVLNHLDRFAEAESACRLAVELAPELGTAYLNLGNALKFQGRIDEAEAAMTTALGLEPDNLVAYRNFAHLRILQGRLEEAIACLDQGLALDPADGDCRFVRGTILLTLGEFERGWEDYEYRYAMQATAHRKLWFRQPEWRGEPLEGKAILVYDEQGFGDTLQFARYLPMVQALGARVYFRVIRDLVPLFRGFPGIDGLFARHEEPPPFDYVCDLLSLPPALKTRLDSIPAAIPYLHADPRRVEDWRRRLAGYGGIKAGLVWAGTPTLNGDQWRSPGLKALAPLFEAPGTTFFALQKGPGRAELEGFEAPANFVDLGPEIENFEDTAAIMTALDLVISSCTAPAHLAGALGRPTWTLLSSAADWRWLRERLDSPWYPTMRLFRQPVLGDWSAVARDARDALALMR